MSTTTPERPARTETPQPGPAGGRWVTWLLVAAVIGLIAVNIWYVLGRDGDGHVEVNEPAPDFTLPLYASSTELGDEVELSSLRGKAVVLEFWSTTCGACRKGFPIIERLHRERDDDVVVLTINTEAATPSQARQAVGRFLDQNGYAVPVLMDNGSVSRAYGVRAIPHTVVIGRDGNVVSMHTGVVADSKLRAEVASALD